METGKGSCSDSCWGIILQAVTADSSSSSYQSQASLDQRKPVWLGLGRGGGVLLFVLFNRPRSPDKSCLSSISADRSAATLTLLQRCFLSAEAKRLKPVLVSRDGVWSTETEGRGGAFTWRGGGGSKHEIRGIREAGRRVRPQAQQKQMICLWFLTLPLSCSCSFYPRGSFYPVSLRLGGSCRYSEELFLFSITV